MTEQELLDWAMDGVERRMTTLDNPAICVKCGNEQDGEPDMWKGECEACGSHTVYGAEELLLRLA